MTKPIARNIRLFLSYATEDQRLSDEIYSRLKGDFDVWYFPESVLPGDSQFASISDALNECDYGIPILSLAYIEKAWTNAELRGLWTIQIERRSKVIIPVWYNVRKADVIRLSPMLADLNAIVSDDADKIVEEIRISVGVGEQVRGKYSPLVRALQQLQSTLAMETAY